ncbi:MAG TPA: 30S ribosomal protein S3 [Candidatus Stercoripulliclostridium merdipullorum]|uniref:Small ribosomal subunit protein uS3 n=1 Tax=Candidatus Stercoripulliclostridium merdipullorum TaxID=2840952 RepID=A0A9D1NBY1_9FIRM|nr:30S ribosomal protein S3 [Candidatus Stercoripulliclostridium merdipullorum]
MGQKVNPHGLRVGVIASWNTKWYANKKHFGKFLKEDYEIRKYLKTNYYDAAISKITIDRAADTVVINMYCGRPGIAIGKAKKDAEAPAAKRGIDEINKNIAKIVGNKKFNVNVHEVKNINLDAQLVAESIAASLEKRMPFRRAMKSAMGFTMRAGAKGIKTMVSGRLDGAEIARSESYHEGSIPLQTLRADIDYGFAEAHTTYGIIGVKAWIYKGEVFTKVKGGND